MEDHQDEIATPAAPVGDSTVTQGGPSNADASHTPPTSDEDNDRPSLLEYFNCEGFIYILLKHYDTERQCFTAMCGFAVKETDKVTKAIEKVLPELALPKISNASTLTIWKEVGLDNARIIESYSTFEDEGLTSGSVIILQNKPSAEEYEMAFLTRDTELTSTGPNSSRSAETLPTLPTTCTISASARTTPTESTATSRNPTSPATTSPAR